MVALGSQRSCGGLGQIRIGLQGFVKYLHLPAFFVGRGDDVMVVIQVTANQMYDPQVVVVVFKDLADHKYFSRISLEPAAHASLVWEIQFICSNKTLFRLVLFTQCDQPVVLECGNKMPAPAGDEIEVLLSRKPAIHQHEAKLQGVADTGLNHLAHHFVLGLVTFTLELFARKVAVLNRLFHQLKRQQAGGSIAVVPRIEQVDPPDGATAAVGKVPAHQLALIGPGLLLNQVIKDQYAIISLHRSDGRLDLLP